MGGPDLHARAVDFRPTQVTVADFVAHVTAEEHRLGVFCEQFAVGPLRLLCDDQIRRQSVFWIDDQLVAAPPVVVLAHSQMLTNLRAREPRIELRALH